MDESNTKYEIVTTYWDKLGYIVAFNSREPYTQIYRKLKKKLGDIDVW